MDKKATALLKLVYLEMFGYDMSWASFHVLEVMSSSKFLQKRAGYLGALQSFRPETEVLMLATNLLKKDLGCPDMQIISLPLITVPNIITPSLAISLLPDVLPRISHSNVSIRKKAVVCLYRLALVYPEALRLAWPKLKDRLMDDEEDSSVVTAVLNVICELGWRRPYDFLPLAPRFFELLVDGGNNWMAIKIIKLFATLTPLEPRLARKLIRPLINIIQTTTAMSLLYECINGIIQGGILDGEGALEETHEIADICVGKLRGMVVTDFDPNLKYVALLAFSRIVLSYPHLVSMHQDVIMNCLEDADISIRLQALELAARMVTKDTLQYVVGRLIGQLENPRHTAANGDNSSDVEDVTGFVDYTERKEPRRYKTSIFIPDDYRVEVLHRILDICSYDNYSRLTDFDWYVSVLIQLVKHLPSRSDGPTRHQGNEINSREDAPSRIGLEMRNVAVRVRNVRMEATRAAEFLLLIDNRQSLFASVPSTESGILGSLAWVAGEYAEFLSLPGQTFQSLIDLSNTSLSAKALSLFVQAAPKVLARIVYDYGEAWSVAQRSEISLFLARMVEFLELLAAHPDLDVQERAIEFLEIMRLASDVMQTKQQAEVPYLLSSVIPSLFYGLELNPVAPNAQKKVPLPDKLRLGVPFNDNVRGLFDYKEDGLNAPINDFYYTGETHTPQQQNDFGTVGLHSSLSYQSPDVIADPATVTSRQKVEWRQRNRDDPFYIGSDEPNKVVAPMVRSSSIMHNEVLDIDSIPIVDLKINRMDGSRTPLAMPHDNQSKLSVQPKRYEVISDEVIGLEEAAGFENSAEPAKAKMGLLQVDSSGLRNFTLGDNESPRVNDNVPRKTEDDTEMVSAMKEVEKIRLEMQRASERVHLEGIPSDGTLIKKRKKAKKAAHGRHREADSLQERDGQLGHGTSASSAHRKAKKRDKMLGEHKS
ncbi:armadillo-type protein [Aspergillus californicus]